MASLPDGRYRQVRNGYRQLLRIRLRTIPNPFTIASVRDALIPPDDLAICTKILDLVNVSSPNWVSLPVHLPPFTHVRLELRFNFKGSAEKCFLIPTLLQRNVPLESLDDRELYGAAMTWISRRIEYEMQIRMVLSAATVLLRTYPLQDAVFAMPSLLAAAHAGIIRPGDRTFYDKLRTLKAPANPAAIPPDLRGTAVLASKLLAQAQLLDPNKPQPAAEVTPKVTYDVPSTAPAWAYPLLDLDMEA
jgi:hypothetical protein